MADGKQQNSSGQGQVKDPESDKRLKENRGSGGEARGSDEDTEPGGQGRVKDPANDQRLKENRDN